MSASQLQLGATPPSGSTIEQRPVHRFGSESLRRIERALSSATSYSYTSGLTHGFYHYPARFAPEIAREVISAFSAPDDFVLDPFMGGGTSIIEGLAFGRRMIGLDLNALAHFVSDVRTDPLSSTDEVLVTRWATDSATRIRASDRRSSRIKNLPPAVETFMQYALELAATLPRRRQQRFARCVLLRLGQWALDCRDFRVIRQRQLADRLPELAAEMIEGMRDFVSACNAQGIKKTAVSARRHLVHASAVGVETHRIFRSGEIRPKLVMTSPPYPSVHVLYHRWQHRGRRETPAPYWIANVPDGRFESFYTGGSRTPAGRQNYFNMIGAAFRSIRAVIDPRGLVAQLVGFSSVTEQLPQYLDAIESAGFEEVSVSDGRERFGRRVPNRKWYAKLQSSSGASRELLILHRPA